MKIEKLERFLARLDKHNLSLPRFRILLNLARKPNFQESRCTLADELSYHQTSIAHQITFLHDQGYIQQFPGIMDRRFSYIKLTVKGLETLKRFGVEVETHEAASV
jgi:DNA-binding MarR family transcriptional regulator